MYGRLSCMVSTANIHFPICIRSCAVRVGRRQFESCCCYVVVSTEQCQLPRHLPPCLSLLTADAVVTLASSHLVVQSSPLVGYGHLLSLSIVGTQSHYWAVEWSSLEWCWRHAFIGRYTTYSNSIFIIYTECLLATSQPISTYIPIC